MYQIYIQEKHSFFFFFPSNFIRVSFDDMFEPFCKDVFTRTYVPGLVHHLQLEIIMFFFFLKKGYIVISIAVRYIINVSLCGKISILDNYGMRKLIKDRYSYRASHYSIRGFPFAF